MLFPVKCYKFFGSSTCPLKPLLQSEKQNSDTILLVWDRSNKYNINMIQMVTHVVLKIYYNIYTIYIAGGITKQKVYDLM